MRPTTRLSAREENHDHKERLVKVRGKEKNKCVAGRKNTKKRKAIDKKREKTLKKKGEVEKLRRLTIKSDTKLYEE